MDIRSRSPFPSLPTETLREYFGSDPLRRRAAAHELFEQFGAAIEERVVHSLRRRHGALAADAIQEAWMRCLTQLHRDKTVYMRSRPERPSVGLLMVTHTMRAVWQLEQQARRRARRDRNGATRDAPFTGLGRVADTAVGVEDLHQIFECVWARLLEASSDEQRTTLQRVGPIEFFAGEWRLPASEPSLEPFERAVVLERLDAAARILRELLETRYHLDPSAQRRFQSWLLPSVQSKGDR